jgi:hypothetical protein
MKRYALFILGILFIIIGTVGLLIPVFPTVPFYIVAAICFSKGDKRFKLWLQEQNFYRKYLKKHLDKRM